MDWLLVLMQSKCKDGNETLSTIFLPLHSFRYLAQFNIFGLPVPALSLSSVNPINMPLQPPPLLLSPPPQKNKGSIWVTGQHITAGRGGRLVAADLLVFIRMLLFSMADFGCATKKGCYHQTSKMDTHHSAIWARRTD